MKRRRPCLGRILKDGLKGHIDRVYRKLYRTPVPQEDLIKEAISVNGTKESSRKTSLASSTTTISTYKGMF